MFSLHVFVDQWCIVLLVFALLCVCKHFFALHSNNVAVLSVWLSFAVLLARCLLLLYVFIAL